jgi:hypothetical protein
MYLLMPARQTNNDSNARMTMLAELNTTNKKKLKLVQPKTLLRITTMLLKDIFGD